MATAIVTGSGGLIGSESVQYFVEQGFDVIGLENDMRSSFFGPDASTRPVSERLVERYPDEFRWIELDIRDADGVDKVFAEQRSDLELIVHTAAQPSHDWAASDPQTDFGVNANGTLNLLEATRRRKPDATFVFCSTNKVYGDLPNFLPLEELEHAPRAARGPRVLRGHPHVDVDRRLDALALRRLEGGGRPDGPGVRALLRDADGLLPRRLPDRARTTPGAQLHGFLAYLLRCTVTGDPYTVFGYGAKQVRDNIHSADVVRAFAEFHKAPKTAAVYNLGGGRASNCSMLEAIELCEQIAGRELNWELSDQARMGDHRWWISDLREFQRRLSRLEARVRRRGDAARELRAERGAVDGPGLKISVGHPRPQRGGIDHRDDRRSRSGARGSGNRLRDPRRRRLEHRPDAGGRPAHRARRTRASATTRSHYPRGFGFTVRAGLDEFEGDAVAIVMADASDDPADLVRYHRLLEEGYDCAFGSRFMRGGAVHDYPRLKLVINRIANSFIRMLFRHGYNDTTNAFKAYRREVIETVQPLLSNHFNLTVELPLKAIVRGHSYGDRPDHLAQPEGRDIEAVDAGDGEPLPLHRPLRPPRAVSQPRRLPTVRLHRLRPGEQTPRGRLGRGTTGRRGE